MSSSFSAEKVRSLVSTGTDSFQDLHSLMLMLISKIWGLNLFL